MTSPEYDWTLNKLNNIIVGLESCIRANSLDDADTYLSTLRQYDKCAYCRRYRASLEERGWQGCCGACPLHKLGEKIIGRNRPYNGCYVIGAYRDMVKAAYQYMEQPSLDMLRVCVDEIKRVLVEMDYYKGEL